jgi:hypothetical protein
MAANRVTPVARWREDLKRSQPLSDQIDRQGQLAVVMLEHHVE